MRPQKRLNGSIQNVDDLSGEDRSRMFALLTKYFDGYERQNFDKDLNGKDGAVVLRNAAGSIQGFTTFQYLSITVYSTRVRAVFSGDTIVDREHWGQNELAEVWSRHMLAVAERDSTPLYWFLICSGYKTYKYLHAFLAEFYPRYDVPTPAFEQQILDTLAKTKFGDQYDERTGLIRFAHSQERLKPGVADVADSRLANRHVRFFIEKNPDHMQGTELACLARISRTNYHKRALKLIGLG